MGVSALQEYDHGYVRIRYRDTATTVTSACCLYCACDAVVQQHLLLRIRGAVLQISLKLYLFNLSVRTMYCVATRTTHHTHSFYIHTCLQAYPDVVTLLFVLWPEELQLRRPWQMLSDVHFGRAWDHPLYHYINGGFHTPGR